MSGEVRFQFEGREVVARPGQSIGAALLAAGVRTLSWSVRYRRPRGLRCVRGACPGCHVRVDGLPGVAACVTPVHGGERVERERPAAARLPIGLAARLAPAGFHLSPWLGRARVWRRVEPVLAWLAGVSRPPAPGAVPIGSYEARSVDVLVVGAGERGLRAAASAGEGGATVLVVERDWRPGGRLLDEDGGAAEAATLLGAAVAAGAEVRLESVALGGDATGAWAVAVPGGLLVVRPGRVVLATGSWDRELALPDGDRPGVMTAGAVRRLLVREKVGPGRVAAVVATPDADPGLEEVLAGHGIALAIRCAPADVDRVLGRGAVRGIRVRGVDHACDLVVIDAGRRPADELARQPVVLEPPGEGDDPDPPRC